MIHVNQHTQTETLVSNRSASISSNNMYNKHLINYTLNRIHACIAHKAILNNTITQQGYYCILQTLTET